MAAPNIKYFLNSKYKRLTYNLVAESLLILIGMSLLITFLGPADYHFKGLDIQVALKPSWHGQTVVQLPPFGTLTMQTHQTPIELQLTLQNIHPEVLQTVFTLTASTLWQRFAPDVSTTIFGFIGKQLVLGGLGAALAIWICRRASLRKCLKAAAAGFFLAGALFAATWSTYDLKAMREPKFDGIIAFAPQMLALAEETMTEFSDFRVKATQLTSNIQHLLFKIEQMNLMQTPAAGDTKLLAVSDLHNNPLGIDLTLALAKHFKVDAVLDAGDLTDYGSALELKIVNSLQQLQAPYIFAAGNHDSPAISEFIKNLPQGRALEGKIIAVNGLNILGSPDPSASRPFSVQSKDSSEQIADLEKALQKSKVPPDLLLVHNPDVARAFAGRIPVLVAGHTHRQAVEKIGGSLLINPGTTGAAGTRGLDAKSGVPYSAAILYFTGNQRRELRAVDAIKYNPLSGKFSVERQVFHETQAH